MKPKRALPSEEPPIAVGLLEDVAEAHFTLRGAFLDGEGKSFPEGEYSVGRRGEALEVKGPRSSQTEPAQTLQLAPLEPRHARFSLQATVGRSFHWEQRELQSFEGSLRVVASGPDRLHLINDVALETYITSVICSEMDASSPPELIKAHAVISRSWLLAGRGAAHRRGHGAGGVAEAPEGGEWIRIYDREVHEGFDVCADDHCQRYHGVARVRSETARKAVEETRGRVLVYGGGICDARYSKCCGGVTEDFRVAWADTRVPYLTPVVDAPGCRLEPEAPWSDERVLRRALEAPPSGIYCDCSNEEILSSVLTDRDRLTKDFFRWSVRLGAEEASALVAEKLGTSLGRLLRLEPVERGSSGRLKLLRLVGERHSLIVGKELEIRRLLSPTHLYSSAFVVGTEGLSARPDVFILRGAGWGHGVGLCQIGAAVMAGRGAGYEEILAHYYRGARVEGAYR